MSLTSSSTTTFGVRQETHRVYLQTTQEQLVRGTSMNTTKNTCARQPEAAAKTTSRETTTLSATVRLTDSATCGDVAKLLRRKFQIHTRRTVTQQHQHHQQQQEDDDDVLVLVGTIQLPSNVIRFAPPLVLLVAADQPQELAKIATTTTMPVHFMKTLRPQDALLTCRDSMLHTMEKKRQEMLAVFAASSAVIPGSDSSNFITLAPNFQWFFQPDCNSSLPMMTTTTNTTTSTTNSALSTVQTLQHQPTMLQPISYIQLDDDGYCTSMEEDPFQSVDDETSVTSTTTHHDQNQSIYNDDDDTSTTTTSAEVITTTTNNNNNTHHIYISSKKSIEKQLRQKAILEQRLIYRKDGNIDNAILTNNCTTTTMDAAYFVHGILEKRCAKDLNIWKRVYCILLEDELWFISRIKMVAAPQQQHTTTTTLLQLPIHCKISLSLGIVTATEEEEVILPPNVFAVQAMNQPSSTSTTTNRRTTHYFRASQKDMQLRWIEAIANSIVMCAESSSIAMAEMIITEEEYSRASRLESEILAKCLSNATAIPGQPPIIRGTYLWSLTGDGGEFVDLVRFGVLLQEYREACRHYRSSSSSTVSSNNVNTMFVHYSNNNNDATVNQIKRAKQQACEETVQKVSSLWEMAAIVCALSVAPNLESSPLVLPSSKSIHLKHAESNTNNEIKRTNSDDNSNANNNNHSCKEEHGKDLILQQLQNLRNSLFCDIQETIHILLDLKASSAPLDESNIPSAPDMDLFDKVLALRMKLAKFDEIQHKADGLFGS